MRRGSSAGLPGWLLFDLHLQSTFAAGAAQILWGSPDFGYVGAILIGSIPGILIGSQLSVTIPERALRGSLAGVLALSGLKLLGAF